jgi:hypothetical protein
MRIEDVDSGTQVKSLGLRLTAAEAAELRDALEALLADPQTERHEHVSSADYQTEITVWIGSA